jgi:enamine deaminase RidA (YjgF/YER057c/UK114 family)
MARTVVRTTDAPPSLATYRQAVNAGGLVFVSGTGPLELDTGKIKGETNQELTRQCLINISAILKAIFSTVKSELNDRFDSCGEAKMELFDYIEVFFNQRRRHSTIGQISPAAFEKAWTAQLAQENCEGDQSKLTSISQRGEVSCIL